MCSLNHNSILSAGELNKCSVNAGICDADITLLISFATISQKSLQEMNFYNSR